MGERVRGGRTEETHDEPRFEVRGEEHGEELNVRRVDAEGDESLKEQPASEETLDRKSVV